jgi:hypothetical protein
MKLHEKAARDLDRLSCFSCSFVDESPSSDVASINQAA